jgi:antirestriction protein ArdC
LNRVGIGSSYYSEAYAYEELVAEATATILLRHFNIASDNIEVHAAYFHSWYNDLENQEEAVAYAKQEAQRAAQYILGSI